jgi:hypothetical protein
MQVLATAGDPNLTPFVSIRDEGGTTLVLRLTRTEFGGIKTTETYRMSRQELRLIAECVLRCLDWQDV